MTHRIHLEHLLGRKVVDVDGKNAGRIEEFRCAPGANGTTIITEFLLGKGGLWERLSISGLSLTFTGLLGASTRHATHRVAWDEIDLSDLRHPKFKRSRDQLRKI